VERNEYLRMSQMLRQVLMDEKPELIHAGSIQTASLIAAMSGFHPLLSMSWGYDLLMDAESTCQMRQDTRFTLDRSDVLVCDSDAVQNKAKEFGFPIGRVVKFPWGTDLQHFTPNHREADRQRLGFDDDSFVILSSRSWEQIYGVKTIVEAFIQAAKAEPKLCLMLLGGGSQGNLLMQMVQVGGAMGQVVFCGRKGFDELPAFYRAADIYVSASLTDGSSVSLMEALACGTPALLSAIPGNLEWVTEGLEGWFFPIGDSRQLSEKMTAIFRKREDLAVMRQRARRLAEERADWAKNFQALLRAYELAMNIGRVRA